MDGPEAAGTQDLGWLLDDLASGAGLVAYEMAIIVDSGRLAEPADRFGFSPEHQRILRLGQQPATVADVASDTGLPVGVIRALLADLIQQRRIRVLPGRAAGKPPSARLLREVLHGLRAL